MQMQQTNTNVIDSIEPRTSTNPKEEPQYNQ